MHTTPTPAIGHVVIYRSRTGDYDLPAIVAGTYGSPLPPDVAELSGDRHVHLTVFSPIGLAASVADDIPEATGEIEPGTWRWPPAP